MAAAYHTWYGQCCYFLVETIRWDEGHVARLWLIDAVTQVLRSGSALLGAEAPERM